FGQDGVNCVLPAAEVLLVEAPRRGEWRVPAAHLLLVPAPRYRVLCLFLALGFSPDRLNLRLPAADLLAVALPRRRLALCQASLPRFALLANRGSPHSYFLPILSVGLL